MSLVSINWKPNKQELRRFGLTMLVGFGLIGLAFMFWPWEWPISQNRNAAIGCWIFAGVACGLGLTGTRLALGVYMPWMSVALVMGHIIGRLLIAAFYYMAITPMGLVMRLTGRDRLRLKKRDCTSYWVDKKPRGDNSSYERQF